MWVALALLTALFESGKDLFGKKGLQEQADEYVVAWAWRLLALPFLLPLLLVIEVRWPAPVFWPALLAGGALNLLTAILYMKAIKASDLSLTVPLVTFTPLFLLFTSPLMLGEMPGPFGVIGVVLIVAGSYLLNIKERRRGALAPLRALLGEPGPRLMLAVALIWSLTANIDKVGVQASTPLTWAIAVNAVISLGMLPLVLWRWRSGRALQALPWKSLIPVGLCGGLATLCQMTAISLALVPYVIAIKRLSILFSSLAGYLFFKEKGFRERLAGSLVMLAGVAFIIL